MAWVTGRSISVVRLRRRGGEGDELGLRGRIVTAMRYCDASRAYKRKASVGISHARVPSYLAVDRSNSSRNGLDQFVN
jgi:uncharacterized alpha-E superfamily protein